MQFSSLPPLDALKGFVAAARRRSITAAAEELCLTQSAVSRQIQSLEERLGTALFVRGNRSIALTDAGERLGSFFGVWLGGLAFDATGSYDALWPGAIAVGLFAAAIHWPIRDTPVRAGARPAVQVRILAVLALGVLAGWGVLRMLRPDALLAAWSMC